MAAEFAVAAGETEVAHHLMIIDPAASYEVGGFSISWR
jgi:hypothetical protein